MEGEQGFHAGEKPLQSGFLKEVKLSQLVHVDAEEDFQGADVVHLCLHQLWGHQKTFGLRA